MILRTPLSPASAPRAVASWQHQLAEGVSDPAELLRLLGLERSLLAGAQAAGGAFPLRVPRAFVARMEPGNPRDPLLRQVLPLGEELAQVPGYGVDPLAEAAATSAGGLLHKYHGRVLLVLTGACAVHCRYCFRRHFPYADHHPGWEGWGEALAYIAADPSIEEVLLSGGDPLAVSDSRLAKLAAELAAIPHLQRLRVHTRLPVVLPDRVDEDLLAWLTGTRLLPVVVVHVNHPNEIDGAVVAAVGRLRGAGVTVLNQAVLLAGVNDDVATLARLSTKLFAAGVLPYYLHVLDPVAGAAHFDVPDARAQEIVGALAARLPGYLVPKLVREVPEKPAKWPLGVVPGKAPGQVSCP